MNPPFHPQSIFPSANFHSFHLPHIETHPWGPHPPPVLQANCALPGPTILHWGTRFCICTLIPNYSLFIWYIVKILCFQHLHILLSSPLTTFFPYLENKTHVALGWGTTYHLPLLTSPIYFEYPTGHLPLPSEFLHFVLPLAQLIPYLIVPLTLDLVERLRPLIPHTNPQPRAVLSLHTS
jgi:hypothetical protein